MYKSTGQRIISAALGLALAGAPALADAETSKSNSRIEGQMLTEETSFTDSELISTIGDGELVQVEEIHTPITPPVLYEEVIETETTEYTPVTPVLYEEVEETETTEYTPVTPVAKYAPFSPITPVAKYAPFSPITPVAKYAPFAPSYESAVRPIAQAKQHKVLTKSYKRY